MWRKITGLIGVMLLTLILFPVQGFAVAVNQPSIATNGQWNSYELLTDEFHYIPVHITESGLLEISARVFAPIAEVFILDGDYRKIASKWCNGDPARAVFADFSYYFEKGTYYLAVKCITSGGESGAGDYDVKATFTPTKNVETEPNQTYKEAMRIKSNTLYRGLLSYQDVIDFYSFIPTSSGEYSLLMYALEGTKHVSLYDSNLRELQVKWCYEGTSEIKALFSPGIYYIKVQNGHGFGSSGPYEFKIEEKGQVASISLNQTKMDLGKGTSITLKATVAPSDALNKNITWTSSNGKIATVSKGVVTAKKYGVVTIIATSHNGKTAKCTVTVVPRKVAQKTPMLSSKKVKLQWNAIDDVQGYKIAYSKNGDDYTLLKDVKRASTKTFTTDELSKGKYSFKIRAYIKLDGKITYGKYSDTMTVTIK